MVSSRKCGLVYAVAAKHEQRGLHAQHLQEVGGGGAAGQLRASAREEVKGFIPRKMETPRLTDAGAGRRFRWSLDIVERCIDQWAEAAMVGCKKSVLQS